MPVMLMLAAALGFQQPAGPPATTAQLPTLVVSADDTKIDRSCIVQIDKGRVIADANGNGVIQIAADGVTVEFAPDAVLHGSASDVPPDQFTGIGIALDGHHDVVLKACRVSGFKVGVQASRCPGLAVIGGDLSGNFRQRLKSAPQAEDGGDWLYPHHNDKGEWIEKYGAAPAVKDASNISIHDLRVREGQNGVILDRVTGSRLYDNDCSFLSGWGIAMWRSSGNLICRNALDFCVRGYSHGVYNRGQDSAGLLMFEQCSENVIAQNSITHGGDGVFGFAGVEAIGETPAPNPGFDYKRRGCNDKVSTENDLSYAPAHGLEMTFSHGNRVVYNRFASNAICGIWGGYSQGTLIAGNQFEANGEMAYGLERGGINIEHGSNNLIVGNRFKGNKCGIHLWWDDDAGLLSKPGIAANGADVQGNFVADNTFAGDAVGLHLRDTSAAKDKVRGTVFAGNEFEGVAKELEADPAIDVLPDAAAPPHQLSPYEIVGESRPVGARASLAGRQNIVMTEWGPWDHESPLVRAVTTTGALHRYELLRLPGAKISVQQAGGGTDALSMKTDKGDAGSQVVSITATRPGAIGYTLSVSAPEFTRALSGTVLKSRWDVAAFAWQGSADPPLPPADLEAWRTLAAAPGAVKAQVDDLSFKFGYPGPKGIAAVPEFAASKLGGTFYGLIATTSIPLTPGKWRIVVLSDDGVRVRADDKTVIENWTHHGPATDTAEVVIDQPRSVPITVEYFQIAGFAVLDFKIEPER